MTDPRELEQTVDVVATRVESRVTDMIVRTDRPRALRLLGARPRQPFLPVVIWSVILAVALQPVHAWLAARLGGSRRLAAVARLAIIINSGRPHGNWVDRSIPPVAHKLALSPTCAAGGNGRKEMLLALPTNAA